MEKYINQITEMAISYAPKILGAAITLIIGFWLAKLISSLVRKRMEKRNADPTITPFVSAVVSITIKVLVLLSAAAMFGLETTSFVAVLGAVAFAIGLALQGSLGHFAAGILILIFKPYRVNDIIVSNGYTGTVSEIQLFTTHLNTRDNRVVIIPNGIVISNPLENLSANPVRKVPMTFGISYSDDIDKAREVIKEVADGCPLILHEEGVDILVEELADSSVNFTVRPWCKTKDYWQVNFYMQEHIKKAFDEKGIGIPFPQMDVHLDNISAS